MPLGEEGEATAPAEEDPLRRFLFEEADVFSEPFEDFPAADEEEADAFLLLFVVEFGVFGVFGPFPMMFLFIDSRTTHSI